MKSHTAAQPANGNAQPIVANTSTNTELNAPTPPSNNPAQESNRGFWAMVILTVIAGAVLMNIGFSLLLPLLTTSVLIAAIGITICGLGALAGLGKFIYDKCCNKSPEVKTTAASSFSSYRNNTVTQNMLNQSNGDYSKVNTNTPSSTQTTKNLPEQNRNSVNDNLNTNNNSHYGMNRSQ